MQQETASTAFLHYGSIYKKMDEQLRSRLTCQPHKISSQSCLSQFLHFSCDIYIEVQNGIGVILVTTDPENAPIERFGMNHRIHIKPNVYFSMVATTPELTVNIYSDSSFSLDAFALATPYEVHPVLPRILIRDILGYFYRIRTPGYVFEGEQHNFFELTYVDTGELHTEVDGVSYHLREKEMILYGPGQFHRQHASEHNGISYVTILFDMDNISADAAPDWYAPLLGRIFPYTKKSYTIMKALVQESASGLP